MRLWSLHPCYLDPKGLVALWREGLLARAVLRGVTQGYRHHPQCVRFLQSEQPLVAIEAYLWEVYQESVRRGYRFEAGKLGPLLSHEKLPVTEGQLRYEWDLLTEKIQRRNPAYDERIRNITHPRPHPLFRVVPGAVEPWEKRHGERKTSP